MRPLFCSIFLLVSVCFNTTMAQPDSVVIEDPKSKQIPLQFRQLPQIIPDCNHGHICCYAACDCCPRQNISWDQELDFDERLLLKVKISLSYPASEAPPKKAQLTIIQDTLEDGRVSGRHLENPYTNDWAFEYGYYKQYIQLINKKTGRKVISDIEDVYEKQGVYFIRFSGKLGIMDSTFRWKIKPYQMVSRWGRNESSIMLVDNARYGLLDSMGEILLPMEYDEIRAYGHNVYRLKKDGLESLVDQDFKTIIPFKFKKVNRYYNPYKELYIVQDKNGKEGMIDSSGSFMIKPEYDDIRPIRDNKGYIVVDQNKKGVYSTEFEEVLPLIHDSIYVTSLIYANKGGLWGFFELDGTPITEYKYLLGTKSNYGFYHIRDGIYRGIVTGGFPAKNKVILGNYILISGTFPDHANKKNYFVIRTDKKYGILEARENKVIIPMEYDEIRTKKYFHGKTKNIAREDIYLRKGDKWALFKGEGVELEFNISNISEEINRNYEFRYGIQTSIVFQ